MYVIISSIPFPLQILRYDDLATQYYVVGESRLLQSSSWSSLEYEVIVRRPLRVQRGDIVGFSYKGFNPVSYAPNQACVLVLLTITF